MATTSNPSLERFTTFYDGWLVRHQQLQQNLLAQINVRSDDDEEEVNNDNNKLVLKQVSDHYREYYQQKSLAIENDVFLVCSPPWYTSFEQTLFWVTDFPPWMFLRFVRNVNLTAEQEKRLETVKVETTRKEREIGEAMAMVQETLVTAPLYGLINRTERLANGEVSELDEAMEELKEAMRLVVMEADALRENTVMEILELLNVIQRVKFFAAVGEFRIRTRRVGMQMDTPPTN